MKIQNNAKVRARMAALIAEHNPLFTPEYVESNMTRMADEAVRYMQAVPDAPQATTATMGFAIRVQRNDDTLVVNYMLDGNTMFWDAT